MSFGGFYKGEKKKAKKSALEKRAQNVSSATQYTPPQIEIIKKGKKEW